MMTTETPTVMFMRARRGVVGERDRVTHVLSAPGTAGLPELLTAFCEVRMRPVDADLMDAPLGMPCVACLAQAGVFHQLPSGFHPLRIEATDSDPTDTGQV